MLQMKNNAFLAAKKNNISYRLLSFKPLLYLCHLKCIDKVVVRIL